jgi:group I intron endonuclease
MKVYIGQAKVFNTRKRKHLTSKEDDYFHRAIRKYGTHNFGFTIIKDDIESQFELDDWEMWYINFYKSFGPGGYTSGGKGCIGYKHTEETKEKLRQKALGRKASEETKLKMSNARKGVSTGPFTQERRENISKARRLVKP